jgi:hypothetical protein
MPEAEWLGAREKLLIREQAADDDRTEVKKPLYSWWNDLQDRNGIVAYLPIIFVTILMFCGAAWQIFWPTTDAARYQCYALTFWLGKSALHLVPPSQCMFLNIAAAQGPFHMLPIEYPPLTLVLFSLALFAPLQDYQLIFALLMALTSVLIYWLLQRYGPRGSAITFALYVLVGAWATAEGRFDLVPAALTLLCIIAAERKHWTAAYVALAFGTLLKLYPLLLLPALFIAEQRDAQRLYVPVATMTLKRLPSELWRTLKGIGSWRWSNALIFAIILIGITGLFALLDFQNAVVSQISYFTHRPVQIESTGSTILWIATHFGFPAHVEFTFGSLNIVSALENSVAAFFEGVFVLGYIFTLWQQWRGRIDLLQTFIALHLVFIATGKVFSPQYLIWLMPLLAYASAIDGLWILCWGSISLLTTIIYPYLYTRTPDVMKVVYVPGFTQMVAVRDTLFVLLTLMYLFNTFHIRRRRPLPERPALLYRQPEAPARSS